MTTGPRPSGMVTRGTTNPNRLRRFDRWMLHRMGNELARTDDPLVVDLGFGASPVTTLELAARLRERGPVSVLGLEIDPLRVAQAQPMAGADVSFALGGFEVPVPRPPLLIRAANVLRQYPEDQVPQAWARMAGRLAPGGLLVEGTCDELGRRCAWVAVSATPATAPAGRPRHTDAPGSASGPVVPETLTLALHLGSLQRPSEVAERLPKVLIHRHVPGEPIHDLLSDLDRAWERAAPHAVFGPRQRWLAAVAALRAAGWPVADGRRRWRLGELTVAWSAVAPRAMAS